MTPASLEALSALRRTDTLQWYVVPLLAGVLYVYAAEIERRRWDVVLSGLILAASEFLWEIANALLLHASGFAALWTTPGRSAFVILAGLNVEIYSMFLVAGVIVLKTLPEDRSLKIGGIPNRVLLPLAWGVFCTFVEVLLNKAGLLVWEWWFWQWPHIYLILAGYTLPFLAIVRIHDTWSLRGKRRALGILVAVDLLAWIVLVNLLGWI